MLLQALCIILYPLVNSNWSYSPETPNLGQIRRFLMPCDLEIRQMTLKNNRAPLLCYFKHCAAFHSHLVNLNWSYSPEKPNRGHIRWFLAPCDLEIWQMTLKNNRAPLLRNIKLYVSFHHHMWIQTGVTVRKRLSWVVTSVTLTFDLWPWRFAWTLPWSVVITPENIVMIRWWENSQKGVTDRQTDRQTDRRTDGQTENTIHRAAWSQLKIWLIDYFISVND